MQKVYFKRGLAGMNEKQIEQALRDYNWMLNSIKMFQDALSNEDTIRVDVTAQGGIESSLPKPKGVTGDPVLQEVIRRDKYWGRVRKYEKVVKSIQSRVHLVKDDREQEVLHWLLEGESYAWIARHMGLSERHIRRLKDSIVSQMSGMPKKPKTTGNCA